MPDNHIDQEIDHDALLRSMGIMAPRPKIVNVKSELEKKGPAGGSKINQFKTATVLKYERITRQAKEIWQQRGYKPGEDLRDWQGVLSGIMSIITSRPNIESARSKVKRIGPAERSKPSQSETETTPELTHELIDDPAKEICEENVCESSEDERNRIEAEGSKENQSETETMPELTHELIADPAKEIWQQQDCEPGEDERNCIETEGSKENQSETTPELTYELIAERAKQIWQQRGCNPGEDEQNWNEAETQLRAESSID